MSDKPKLTRATIPMCPGCKSELVSNNNGEWFACTTCGGRFGLSWPAPDWGYYPNAPAEVWIGPCGAVSRIWASKAAYYAEIEDDCEDPRVNAPHRVPVRGFPPQHS